MVEHNCADIVKLPDESQDARWFLEAQSERKQAAPSSVVRRQADLVSARTECAMTGTSPFSGVCSHAKLRRRIQSFPAPVQIFQG